jgi:hypothetical protein
VRETGVSDELGRFLRGMAAGEIWEQDGARWKLDAPVGQALVKAANGRGLLDAPPPGWVWGALLRATGALLTGRAPTAHEAMRAAERVLEEHRPQEEG